MKSIIAIIVVFLVSKASLEESIKASLKADDKQLEQIVSNDPDHEQTKRFHHPSQHRHAMHPPVILETLPLPTSETESPKITFIPSFPLPQLDPLPPSLKKQEEEEEYYDEERPTTTTVSSTSYVPNHPPPIPFPFLFQKGPFGDREPLAPLQTRKEPTLPEATDDGLPPMFPFPSIQTTLFPPIEMSGVGGGGDGKLEVPELIQDAPDRGNGPPIEIRLFKSLMSSPTHSSFDTLNAPPFIKDLPEFERLEIFDPKNTMFSENHEGGDWSAPSPTTSNNSPIMTTEKALAVQTTPGKKDSDESAENENSDDTEEIKCFTIPDIYKGTKKMVKGFKKGETWVDSFSSVGRSIKKAAKSVTKCGHKVWTDFTHFLGFKKRSISQEKSDDLALIKRSAVEGNSQNYSPEEKKEEEKGGVWTQTSRMARNVQTLAENAGEKFASWFSKRSADYNGDKGVVVLS